MKNLVILFVVFFSLFLTSCSDVTDNSFLTNPVIEKSSVDDVTPSPVYPYPYLTNFTEIKALKYYTPDGENSIHCMLPDYESIFSSLYVVVSFHQESISKTYFIDKIEANNFQVEGINSTQVKDIHVFGFLNNSGSETVSPLANNTALYELVVNNWKIDEDKIVTECAVWPSSLKYVFAEIQTKESNYFIFLQRPYSNNFVIPQYGKYDVQSIRLFGHHALTEKVYALD